MGTTSGPCRGQHSLADDHEDATIVQEQALSHLHYSLMMLMRTQFPMLSQSLEGDGLIAAGDLGAIDKQYDIAASTACGALDYMVVDTTAAAQSCIELLRQRQLGVATFLILEKQAHLQAASQERVQPPEGNCPCRDMFCSMDGVR